MDFHLVIGKLFEGAGAVLVIETNFEEEHERGLMFCTWRAVVDSNTIALDLGNFYEPIL